MEAAEINLIILNLLLLVSTNGQQQQSYRLLGCYTDSNNPLPFFASNNGQQTTDSCVQQCIDANHRYAGTKSGVECFCADSTPPSSNQASKTDCNNACSGDRDQFCGGGGRFMVYDVSGGSNRNNRVGGNRRGGGGFGRFPFSNGKNKNNNQLQSTDISEYTLGCYVDNNKYLSLVASDNGQQTPRGCIQQCSDAGHRYAGTANNQCKCGDSKPPSSSKAPNSDCNTRCGGNQLLFCGGGGRISVYDVSTLDSSNSNNNGNGRNHGGRFQNGGGGGKRPFNRNDD